MEMELSPYTVGYYAGNVIRVWQDLILIYPASYMLPRHFGFQK